jgi:DNA helicase-2/ATP-dependent DNA helicase PcrA
MTVTMNLDMLNENQRRAVEWAGGPLLVLAGPGSGKTRVLTMRIARIVADSPDKSFRVLGLTFTNKAADEMRERLVALLPSTERALLTTFHAFCADVLRQHGSHVGVRPDYTILNQTADQIAFLTEVVRRRLPGADEPTRIAVQYLEDVQQCLDAFCVPEEIPARYADREYGVTVQLLFEGYRQELVARNALDFPSLLFLTYELLVAKPAVAKQLRVVYTHVCIDEFQDTNLAQYRVLRQLLGERPKHLFVVADDDQIIYQWNGASPERLQQIRVDYDMAVIQLPTNYRCPAAVIDIANNLIRHNLDRAADKQPLVAHKARCDHNPICVQAFETQEDEVAWVAQDIHGRGTAEWGRCAVLARARWMLEPVFQALTDSGVPAVITARKDEFQSAPFRWLHASLRLANSRRDVEQLRRVREAFRAIEGVDVELVVIDTDLADRDTHLLRNWLSVASAIPDLPTETAGFFNRISAILAGEFDPERYIAESLAWFDVLMSRDGVADREGFEDYTDEQCAWRELHHATRSKYAGETITLPVLLQEFDMCSKTPSPSPDAVRCFTVHAAKGMEFEHVYVVGMYDGGMPSWKSLKKGDQSSEMREERRNCFVAITRTQMSLTLTYARRMNGYSQEPSRFLTEMGLI